MSRTRRTSIFAIALGALLLVSACSGDGSSGAAITVNGEQVSFNEFSDELRAYGDDGNALALDSVTQQVQATDPAASIEPTSGEAVAAPVAAQIATTRVAYTLVRQELADRDIEVTDEDVDAARDTLSAAPTDPTTGQPADGESPFSQLTDPMQDRFAEDTAAVNALRTALEAEPAASLEVTDEEVAAALAAATEEQCASIIVSASEADAAAALARLQGGEDFAAVATEVSLDQASAAEGGDIGCIAEGETVPELDEALSGLQPGELAGPVSFSSAGADGAPQQAFLVVQLTSRGTPTEDDVRAELQAQADAAAQQEDLLGAFIVEALTDADVEVASRYGRWEPEGITLADGSSSGPTVIPPEGPEQTSGSAPTGNPNTLGIDPATGLPVQEAPAPEGG